jgi:hypothetical protein
MLDELLWPPSFDLGGHVSLEPLEPTAENVALMLAIHEVMVFSGIDHELRFDTLLAEGMPGGAIPVRWSSQPLEPSTVQAT